MRRLATRAPPVSVAEAVSETVPARFVPGSFIVAVGFVLSTSRFVTGPSMRPIVR